MDLKQGFNEKRHAATKFTCANSGVRHTRYLYSSYEITSLKIYIYFLNKLNCKWISKTSIPSRSNSVSITSGYIVTCSTLKVNPQGNTISLALSYQHVYYLLINRYI